jgi:hypothetical protein
MTELLAPPPTTRTCFLFKTVSYLQVTGWVAQTDKATSALVGPAK